MGRRLLRRARLAVTAAGLAADAALRRVLPDVVGMAGLGLVCAGIYLLWGPGWTLIAAGTPLCLAYLARELAGGAAKKEE